MARTFNHPSIGGTSVVQTPSNMVSIPTLFLCGHSSTNTVTFKVDTPTMKICNRACSSPTCQAKLPAEICNGPRAMLGDNEGKFIRTMTSNFQLASMSCEGSLRQFSMAEPMLAEEMADAGCNASIIQALQGAGQCDRSKATATYLGHRTAIATLDEFKACVRNCGSQWAANTVANEIQALHDNMQKKLIAVQQAVFRLTQYWYPAPGHPFRMLDGINSFEQGWGKEQLTTLRSTSEGWAILPLPMTNQNILAAKACISSAKKEIETFQNNERAVFFSDYPGVEALYATGQMKETSLILAEQEKTDSEDIAFNFSTFVIDASEEPVSLDIRSLRSERVLSSKMAQNKLSVDMGKVNAYTSDPFQCRTNPWWSMCKN